MGEDSVALEPNRFKLFLEPCGKQSRILTGMCNTSGKFRVSLLITRAERGIGILWVIGYVI